MYIKRWNSVHTLAKHARQTVDFVNVLNQRLHYIIHVYVCDTDYNVGIHRYTQLKLY